MLLEAVKTLDHFPSIAECEQLAKEQGFHAVNGWKYFEESGCRTCGGPGWHWVLRLDRGVAVLACDDCRAGKNQQRAPKPAITHTMKQCPQMIWLCPGSVNPNAALRAWENSWALDEGRELPHPGRNSQ
tara:strand:- start:1070 stop:1456 length:387 start_codon:yes stop_codon:yes gene_type:complete